MSCSPASFQPSHSDGSNELHEYETMFDTHKEGKSKTFVCKIIDCCKIFRYRSEIVRHVATHSAQRPYVCSFEFCKKTFKRTDALENHMRTHTKESPYLCEHVDCEATFTTKASLRYHLLKHKDEKTFICTFPGCTKAFITSFQLKQHEKSSCVHQKVKNFVIADGTVKEANQTSDKEPVIKKILKENPPAAQETEPQGFVKAERNVGPMQVPQNNIYGENIENIVTENEVLKRRLELSSKIIGLLQYKMQGEPINGPEYLFANRFPEHYLRMQFFNQQQQQQMDHMQQQQQNY